MGFVSDDCVLGDRDKIGIYRRAAASHRSPFVAGLREVLISWSSVRRARSSLTLSGALAGLCSSGEQRRLQEGAGELCCFFLGGVARLKWADCSSGYVRCRMGARMFSAWLRLSRRSLTTFSTAAAMASTSFLHYSF